MTRNEFECLPDKDKVAKKLYIKERRGIYEGLLEEELTCCPVCHKERIADPHHIWPRSQAPLWYLFQRKNIVFIGKNCHRAIHDNGLVVPEFERIKNELKKENDDFIRSQRGW